MMQPACYQLVLDRRLGDYTMPDGWAIVAAGNRDSDRAAAMRMPTPLRNRFVHLDFEVDIQEWSGVSDSGGNSPGGDCVPPLSARVAQPIRPRRECLPLTKGLGNLYRAFSARALILGSNTSCLRRAVGTGAATEFSGFLRMFRELPTIDAILVNPRTEPVPENTATQYAVASALAYCASDSNFDRIRAYLDRMPTEFQVLCVRDAIAAPTCHSPHRGVHTVGRSEPPRSRLNHL